MAGNIVNAQELPRARKSEVLFLVILYHLLITGMVICLTYTGVMFFHRILPGWQNDYLVWVGMAVCIEALLAARLVRNTAVFSLEWFTQRCSEWIVLLVCLKVLLYLLHDPAQILQDVLLWDDSFWVTFFTPEYMAVVAAAMAVWLISSQFAHLLIDFEESLDELDLESEGMVIRDRRQTHHALRVMIFGLGLVLVVLVALTHLPTELLEPPTTSLRAAVLILVVYFSLGLLLMALTQFFIQRARWYLQRTPASPGIAIRWALYSLLLLMVVAGLVSMLPTHYSAQLFTDLQFFIGLLMGLVVYGVMVIITPFLYLIQLLAARFPGAGIETPPVRPPVPPQIEPQDPDIYMMLLRSLLFWTLFFSAIVFSFRYYLSLRKESLEELAQRRGWSWLARLIGWIKKRWGRVNRRVEAAVEDSLDSLRGAAARGFRGRGGRAALGRLPARVQVLLAYQKMAAWSQRNGLPRGRAQTPYQYAARIGEIAPALQHEIDALTGLFMEARYTRHPISAADAERARAAGENIRRGLHEQLVRENRP